MFELLIYVFTIISAWLVLIFYVLIAVAPVAVFAFMAYCFWIAMGGHEQHIWTDDVRRRNLEQIFRKTGGSS